MRGQICCTSICLREYHPLHAGISGWFAGTRVGRAMDDAAATTRDPHGGSSNGANTESAADDGHDDRFFSDPATAYRKCLALLRVSHSCSLPQLRAAFREAALECHPDRRGGSEVKMVRVCSCARAACVTEMSCQGTHHTSCSRILLFDCLIFRAWDTAQHVFSDRQGAPAILRSAAMPFGLPNCKIYR